MSMERNSDLLRGPAVSHLADDEQPEHYEGPHTW